MAGDHTKRLSESRPFVPFWGDKADMRRRLVLHRGQRSTAAAEVLFGAFKPADRDQLLPGGPSHKGSGCERQLIAVDLHRIGSVDGFWKRRNGVGVDVNKNFGAINFVSATVGNESVEECGAFWW